MNKKKLKKINKLLYSFSFCFLVLLVATFFAANRFIVLQKDVFYSIGLFFVFLLLICMAVICFLNGTYEIKNPDWFLIHFEGLITKKPGSYYEPEAPFGYVPDDIHTSKTTFKLKALFKLIIGVGIVVFAVFFLVFAVSLLLG